MKQSIIKDVISKRIGIVKHKVFGRKCEIVKIDRNEVAEFLNINHLQQNTISTYNYGLKYDNELVSVMTFSKPRFDKNVEYELCRFANKLGYSVLGGFSKLFKQFILEVNPKSIISYCDISYFSGEIYKQHQFELVRHSTPNYKYFKPGKLLLESRNKYQKHKLHKLLAVYNESISEYKNMTINGYNRIWDCGNAVYVWNGE